MKRYAWLTGVLSLSLGLTACGGSDSDEVIDLDAGAAIKQLRDDVDMLTPMPGVLDTRLDVLEAPKVAGSCSVGELCIPDGIDLAKVGFQPIIAALCAKAASCCETRELTWLYGNAIKSAADCEAAFTDLINNGQSNNFIGVFDDNLETIVRAAHALNDTDVLVEIDGASVSKCAAEIGAQVCDGDGGDSCSPSEAGDEPCSLFSLLKGKERAGDTCDPWYFNECGPGLVCRGQGNSEAAQSGLCTAKAEVGQRCTRQNDCDDLICDFATGTCKAGAQQGEHCEYRDPTFVAVGPFIGGQYRQSTAEVTSIDCAQGLTCNPVTNTCVQQYCAQGSYCRYDAECPSGTVCTSAGSAALWNYSDTILDTFVGLCGPGLADGAACVSAQRGCASGRCFDHDEDESETCQPAVVPCDYGCTEAGCLRCAAGFYCEPGDAGGEQCLALIANGQSCGTSQHLSCASGFCNEGTCEAKVASGGSCSSSYNEQCPAGEYCNDGTCAAGVALGGACNSPGSFSNCASELYCWNANQAGDYRCYKRDYENGPVKELPNGVYCAADDGMCTSGWCRYTSTATYTCATLLAEGAECDPNEESADRCVDGFGCVPNSASSLVGSCTKYKLPGEPCDPDLNECGGYYDGCELRNEAFLCSPYTDDEPFCVSSFAE